MTGEAGLRGADGIGFLPTTDLERARRFFGEALGLAVEEATPFACVVRAGATMLLVTKVEELRPQPFTVFGWAVGDIRAAIAALRSAGVEMLRYEGMPQDTDGVWTTPGGEEIAWFHDPDGNTLSLTRFTNPPT
ncbi:VOC family protein [Dactylosporangium sucinum]|nr:VOC family protein [Dactylosporangium sucinum]